MKINKFLFPAVLIGTALALTRRKLAEPAPVKSASGSTSFEAIEGYIEQQMRRLHIPGISLAIVEGNQIVHQRGFGKAHPGGEAPTPQTPFFIGSLTKSITTLAVMQLVEAGKVELDVPVQHYLPWFRVADPQASAQITVRHLLNQISGLPYFDSATMQADFDDRPDANEHHVRLLSNLKLAYPVGSKFNYSNLNYNILGLIVETASGVSYSDYIQTHIFNPLEMRHSYTSKATAQQNGLAMGFRHWFSLPFPAPNLPIPSGSLPAGYLISCSEDMAHYLIAHLNGGSYGKAQILSPAGIEELHRGAAECIQFGISAGWYGMGWFDIDLDQTKTYSHSGNCPDFSAFMVIVPEQKKGLILLLNADPYGLPPITEELGMGVTALLAGQQPPPIKLEFVQWIMRLLPLIPLLQILGVFSTLRSISRWRRNQAIRPAGASLWGRYILLPLIPNLTLAGLLSYLRSKVPLQFLDLFMPDIAWIARVSGGFAGIWACLRTVLILRTLRKVS